MLVMTDVCVPHKGREGRGTSSHSYALAACQWIKKNSQAGYLLMRSLYRHEWKNRYLVLRGNPGGTKRSFPHLLELMDKQCRLSQGADYQN